MTIGKNDKVFMRDCSVRLLLLSHCTNSKNKTAADFVDTVLDNFVHSSQRNQPAIS